jgi:hypothetical protein
MEELRELVRMRTRYVDELTDRLRQVHRRVDLVFPEFTRHVRINTAMATTILARYRTARVFARASIRTLALLAYDGHHQVGEPLVCARVAAARLSPGAHHSEPYRMQMKYACADIALPVNTLLDVGNTKYDPTPHRNLVSLVSGQGIQIDRAIAYHRKPSPSTPPFLSAP